jgi:hypothetical protein
MDDFSSGYNPPENWRWNLTSFPSEPNFHRSTKHPSTLRRVKFSHVTNQCSNKALHCVLTSEERINEILKSSRSDRSARRSLRPSLILLRLSFDSITHYLLSTYISRLGVMERPDGTARSRHELFGAFDFQSKRLSILTLS